MDKDLTHKDLVERACKWLKNTKKCGIFMTEWRGGPRETPDALGFHRGKYSIIVECKTSLTDFEADKKKYFRKKMGYGMGRERYFMTPPGLLTLDMLPEKWGLLEVYPTKIKIAKKAEPFDKTISQLYNENKLLINALRAVVCNTGHDCDYFKYSEAVKRGEIKPKKRRKR